MIHEFVMAAGSWELELETDTPREVLDELEPYALVCVAPNPLEIAGSDDDDLLAALRWAGAITKPGPQTSIAGSGLAIFMGDEDGKVIAGGGANLPDGEIAASSTDLSFWVQDCISDTGLLVGSTKTQNLGGGPFQWEYTQRQVLDWCADSTSTEWRVNPDLTVDLNTYTVLYGSTPTVTLTRRGQGRENDVTSFDGVFEVTIDAQDYVSQVTVLGAGGIGTIGGASPYFNPQGQPLYVWKVVEDQGVAAGTELGTAASILSRYNTLRQEVRLSTDAYDVRGELECGGLVAVWDPDRGLSAPLGSANPVPFRGDWILPLTLRCTSIDWPVRNGMGVYCRRATAPSTYVWTDLSPYVVWEDQPATITLGANRRWSQGGHRVPLGGRYG